MVSRIEHQNHSKSNKNHNDQRNLYSQPPNMNSQNNDDDIDDEDVKGRRKMIKNGY